MPRVDSVGSSSFLFLFLFLFFFTEFYAVGRAAVFSCSNVDTGFSFSLSFYWVLLGLNGLSRVLLGFTGFCWVLPSFTGFYLVLLGLT